MKRTLKKHFWKYHHTFSGHSFACPFGFLSGSVSTPSMMNALTRSTLMSLGVAQWEGSLVSVLQMSVTLSPRSRLISSFQTAMQRSARHHPIRDSVYIRQAYSQRSKL